MPQLTVRGIPAATMAEISGPLVRELAPICDCAPDSFTIDCLRTESVFEGEAVATFPFIQVGWFDRGREARDRFAKALTERLSAAGIAEVEIAFLVFAKDSYYANGISF